MPENSMDATEQAKNRQFDPSIGKATQFKPGQSGNPGGRPKRPYLTELTEEMLAEKCSNPVERERWKNAQWEKMLKSGVVGAMFMDSAWERTEGKVSQPVEVNGELALTVSERLSKARKRKNHNG